MPDRYLGRTIGKYRVTRHLGTGAFSWVYEAVDLDLEIPVALKILRPEFAGLPEAESRFRREAATAARLRHPNIVTVRDVGLVDGAAFVAMDLHPLTLGRRLSLVGRLPESECVRLGIGIAAALAVAHANGVIHRDIKPDNILLDADGEAVVADFGLARALAASASASSTNQVQGTPHYFSPEQARGHDLDGRSDLYALGITLFRAATGRLPFEGDDWYAVAREHIETPAPSPRTVVATLSPEFDALVLRLLAKDPGARFPNAVAAIDAMAALPTAPMQAANLSRLGSNTIEAFRTPLARRPRAPFVAAAVIALVLSVWSIWNRQATGPGELPTSSVGLDSVTDSSLRTTVPRADSATGADSVRDLPTGSRTDSAVATGREPGATRQSPAPPRTARLEISATEHADVYVDNRLVGRQRWSGEVAPASRIAVRAVLADAPISCASALADTVLTQVRAGQRLAIELTVRPCAGVRFDIQPRDARVAIRPLDGGRPLETRADSAVALSLPVGRYEVRTSAPRCITIVDTLNVVRSTDGSMVSRRLRLLCS